MWVETLLSVPPHHGGEAEPRQLWESQSGSLTCMCYYGCSGEACGLPPQASVLNDSWATREV
jgi:hypothetical protein